MQKVSITITAKLEYFVNDKPSSKKQLENDLKSQLQGKKGVVVLHCDKSVPVEYLVHVAGVATSLNAKVSIATKPQ